MRKNLNSSDHELLMKIRSHQQKESENALRQIYFANYEKVENYILNNRGTSYDAREIFQDAVMVFYEMVREGKFESRSSIATFIYAVSRNIWLKKLRKSTDDSLYFFDTFEGVLYYEESEEAIDSSNLLKETMGQMCDECKTVLKCFYYENLSMKEIKQRFSLGSEQAARTKKHRCLKKLMTLFKKRGITREHVFG